MTALPYGYVAPLPDVEDPIAALESVRPSATTHQLHTTMLSSPIMCVGANESTAVL